MAKLLDHDDLPQRGKVVLDVREQKGLPGFCVWANMSWTPGGVQMPRVVSCHVAAETMEDALLKALDGLIVELDWQLDH